MHTLEERIRAVELYLKYHRSAEAVYSELGYPERATLELWLKEYDLSRALGKGRMAHAHCYSEQQKQAAVEYYLQHDRNLCGTIRALGYPHRETLTEWLDEASADRRRLNTCRSQQPRIEFSLEQKRAAMLELYSKGEPLGAVAEKYGVDVTTLQRWRRDLLRRGRCMSTPKQERTDATEAQETLEKLMAHVESLKAEAKALGAEVHKLRLERDVLEVTAEILKKGKGADPRKLSNREKAAAIGALRQKHSLNELLSVLSMSKSSYFYSCTIAAAGDKYKDLRQRVCTAFNQSESRYGYRRVHAVVTKESGAVSEKVVRRLMREEHLSVVGLKKRRYNSYKGEISAAVPNLIQRDFHAGTPNTKWLTDLTEFRIPAGKVYVSPMIDCFDGFLVSWSISTRADAWMANSMLDRSVHALSGNDHPLVHSDRGSQYRWPGWIARMQAAGLTRSMSGKGCSPDNAAAEGFFGRLKNEFFYGRSWVGVTIQEFIAALDRYLHWYNEKRIKMSLGAMSPMEYRQSLGYVT